MYRFDGKCALVTGAGKGIGRAIVKALYKGGATVYALSRTQADLDSLKTECPHVRTICLNIADWKATEDTLGKIENIDLLVNNAAAINYTSVLEVNEEDIDLIFQTNVKAVMNITRIIAKRMIAKHTTTTDDSTQGVGANCARNSLSGEPTGGAIVNVSSVSSRESSSLFYVYSVSKASLDHMTRCMAAQLGKHQIRVNSVNPCLVMTERATEALTENEAFRKQLVDRIPLGRPADMEDVVNTILFLLSDQSNMINGAIVPVDGGQWCQ